MLADFRSHMFRPHSVMTTARVPFRRVSDHTIYASSLPPDPVVIDLGMHQGGFARALARIRPGARVYGVEPQPELASRLIARYGERVVHAAVAGTGAEQSELLLFEAADMATIRSLDLEHPTATATGQVNIPIVSLDALRQKWDLARADLIKVDIEGAEIELLADGPASFSFARQISVEFHLWRYPADRARIDAIIAQFRAAGWRVQDFTRSHDDVLFLHPDLAVRTGTMYGARFTMGATRRATRLVRRAARIS